MAGYGEGMVCGNGVREWCPRTVCAWGALGVLIGCSWVRQRVPSSMADGRPTVGRHRACSRRTEVRSDFKCRRSRRLPQASVPPKMAVIPALHRRRMREFRRVPSVCVAAWWPRWGAVGCTRCASSNAARAMMASAVRAPHYFVTCTRSCVQPDNGCWLGACGSTGFC